MGGRVRAIVMPQIQDLQKKNILRLIKCARIRALEYHSHRKNFLFRLKGRPSIQFHKDWVPWKSDRLWAKTGIPKVVDGTETVTNDVGHQLSFLDLFVTGFEPKYRH